MPQRNDAGRPPAGPAGPALPPLGDASRCPSCGVPAPATAGWCFYCGVALQGELAERARRIGIEAARLLDERWRAVAELRAAVDMGAGPATGPAAGMATGPAAGPSADMAPPSDRPLSPRSSAAPPPRPARPRPLPAAGPLAEPPPLWPARLAGPPPLPPAALTPPPPPPPTAPSPPPRPRHWRARHATSEATPWSIQNLLLSLGALLVVVAALIFTLAAWGRLGIGGRAVVLAALTGGALGLAALARRRRLTATAEASAVIAVGLLLLDAYAIRRVGLFGLDEPSTAVYQAGALAIVAGVTWLISVPLPLRALQISAAVAGQLPLVALVPELERWQVALLWILQGTVALLLGNRARQPVRGVLVVGGLSVGFSGLLLAVTDALDAANPEVLGRALILVVAAVAAVAVGWTWRPLRPAVVIGSATAASALLVAAIAVLEERASLPWRLAASAGLVLVTAALVLRLPAAWRLGPLLAAGGLGVLVAHGGSAHVLQAIVGPVGWTSQRWSISAERSAQMFVEPFGRPWEGSYAVPLTLALLAAAVAVAYRELALIPVRLRLAVLAGLVAGALLTLPLAADLSLVAAVLADVVLGLALVAVGVLGGNRRRLAALAAGLPVLVVGLFWAAASLSVTLAAVAIVLLALVPLAIGTRPRTRSVVLAAGTLLLIAEVEAVARALDATPGAAAAIATAAAAALAAVGATAITNRDRIAVEAAGCVGVLLGWAGLLAAGWSGPEVFTAAPAVVLLVIGRALRRRRTPDQRWSSWAAYGPGLVLGLAPSLAAAVLDDGWVRPLLLGLVGLLVTAVGAQARLQAPLLLGGTVVAVDVAAQLAPYAAAVPRWALVGTAGVALVLAGATYERRLRDLQRVKEGLGRLE